MNNVASPELTKVVLSLMTTWGIYTYSSQWSTKYSWHFGCVPLQTLHTWKYAMWSHWHHSTAQSVFQFTKADRQTESQNALFWRFRQENWNKYGFLLKGASGSRTGTRGNVVCFEQGFVAPRPMKLWLKKKLFGFTGVWTQDLLCVKQTWQPLHYGGTKNQRTLKLQPCF